MKFKKVLLTALCCVMATAAFAACETDEGSSKKPNSQAPSTQNPSTQAPVVVKTVTEEQWSSIFAAMPATNNVTATASRAVVSGDVAQETTSYYAQVAGNRMYQRSTYYGDEEANYIVNEDGTNYLYSQNENGEWEREEYGAWNYNLTDISYVFSAVAPLFAQLQYDQTAGLYYGNNVVLENGTWLFLSVGFVNGTLSSLTVRYEDGANIIQESYTFSGYGTTKVTIPGEEDDGGNDGGGEVLPPATGVWTEEDWALALSNLLNTTSGTLETNYYLYENGKQVEYWYEQRTVENGTEMYVYAYGDEYYYANVKGTDYIYESTGDTWGKSVYEYGVSYDFTGLENEWYYEEGVLQSIPYLKYNGNFYYAEDFYFESGEDVNFDDITIVVEDAKITYIGINCHNPDWEETVVIEIDYDNATVELPYVESGNEEEGGEDSGVIENNCYVFTVYDEYGNYASGYQIWIRTDTVCFSPLTTDEYGQVYFYPEKYGCGPAEYDVYWTNEQGETEFIVTTSAEYDYYSLWISVDSDEDGGSDEVVSTNPYTIEEWDQLFADIANSDDISVEECNNYYDGADSLRGIYNVNYYVDNGERTYMYMYDSRSGENFARTYSYENGEHILYEYDGVDWYWLGTLEEFTYNVGYHYGDMLNAFASHYELYEDKGNGLLEASDFEYYDSNEGLMCYVNVMDVYIENGRIVKLSADVWCDKLGERAITSATFSNVGLTDVAIPVDRSEDGGEEGGEVVVDPEAEAAWNEAFKNTLSSTDFTVACEQNTPYGEGYGMYQVDDGCRAYDRTQYCYSETGGAEYNETYYERVGSYDYVYEYDYDANEYVCSETTVDDEVYSMGVFEGLLSTMQGMYSEMEYQGNDFFLMNEDYMNASFKVFDQMDRIEVVLMDGYVNAIRCYGYDADGNLCYVTYIFYNYGETEIYLPEVAENGTVTEGNDYITNY